METEGRGEEERETGKPRPQRERDGRASLAMTGKKGGEGTTRRRGERQGRREEGGRGRKERARKGWAPAPLGSPSCPLAGFFWGRFDRDEQDIKYLRAHAGAIFYSPEAVITGRDSKLFLYEVILSLTFLPPPAGHKMSYLPGTSFLIELQPSAISLQRFATCSLNWNRGGSIIIDVRKRCHAGLDPASTIGETPDRVRGDTPGRSGLG